MTPWSEPDRDWLAEQEEVTGRDLFGPPHDPADTGRQLREETGLAPRTARRPAVPGIHDLAEGLGLT